MHAARLSARRVRSAARSLPALIPILILIGQGGTDPVPWPGGAAPDDAAIAEQLAAAHALADLEEFEAYLEAWEKGEDSEHIFLLQDEIDAGIYDVDRLFVFGDALFGHEFRTADGWGDLAAPAPMQRVHLGRRGGRDTFSCAGCHSVGGADGAGTATQNAFFAGDGASIESALVRNAPHAIGLGFVQALAAEMTTDLQLARDGGIALAAERGSAVTVPMVTKGIDFGSITIDPSGAIDDDALEGIDGDLVVKPFGWKGTFSRLRRVIENAALVHFGIQATPVVEAHELQPDPERLGDGPQWYDPDDDGRARELEEGMLTAGAVYLAMVESPQIIGPSDPTLRDRWARGRGVFTDIGCETCHAGELPLLGSTWTELPDTTDGPGVAVNLLADGDTPKAGSRVQLFSDLKRHDMGEALADPHDDPGAPHIGRSVFLTRPLWGLADTAPYLHDGRAATIPEAILAHGGEAQDARDRFAALPDTAKADLHIFLLSLTRAPRLRVPR